MVDDDTCRRRVPRRERACPEAHLWLASRSSSSTRRVSLLYPVIMSGFDADRTYSVRTQNNKEPTGPALELPSQTEKLLLEFLLQYRVGGDFIYRFVC